MVVGHFILTQCPTNAEVVTIFTYQALEVDFGHGDKTNQLLRREVGVSLVHLVVPFANISQCQGIPEAGICGHQGGRSLVQC